MSHCHCHCYLSFNFKLTVKFYLWPRAVVALLASSCLCPSCASTAGAWPASPHSLPLWIAAVSRKVSIAKSWHVSPAATRHDSLHTPFGHWLLARCLTAVGHAANKLPTVSTGCPCALAQLMPSWSNTLCCPC